MGEKWKPRTDDTYYMPDVTNSEFYSYLNWHNDEFDNRTLSRDLVFRTKEEAIKKAKEMLGIYEVDGVEYRKGEKVLVSDLGDGWAERIFYGVCGGVIECVSGNDCEEADFNNGDYFETFDWNMVKKLSQPEIEVTITKNGEPINEPLSLETARRLGIVL